MSTVPISVSHPKIAGQWDWAKNLSNDNDGPRPTEITATSGNSYWWKCKGDPDNQDHSWQMSPASRTSNGQLDSSSISRDDCPYCSGKQTAQNTSLASCFPSVASQLHLDKNNGLKSSDVVVAKRVYCGNEDDTNYRVDVSQDPTIVPHMEFWWKCANGPEHEWSASLKTRLYDRTGCPLCRDSIIWQDADVIELIPDIDQLSRFESDTTLWYFAKMDPFADQAHLGKVYLKPLPINSPKELFTIPGSTVSRVAIDLGVTRLRDSRYVFSGLGEASTFQYSIILCLNRRKNSKSPSGYQFKPYWWWVPNGGQGNDDFWSATVDQVGELVDEFSRDRRDYSGVHEIDKLKIGLSLSGKTWYSLTDAEHEIAEVIDANRHIARDMAPDIAREEIEAAKRVAENASRFAEGKERRFESEGSRMPTPPPTGTHRHLYQCDRCHVIARVEKYIEAEVQEATPYIKSLGLPCPRCGERGRARRTRRMPDGETSILEKAFGIVVPLALPIMLLVVWLVYRNN